MKKASRILLTVLLLGVGASTQAAEGFIGTGTNAGNGYLSK
ncbi:hypothetical protein [Pseudomonas sp. MWU16-30323]|nr:hypothetical protein [Pseudomonas sp. MWU16-30323]